MRDKHEEQRRRITPLLIAFGVSLLLSLLALLAFSAMISGNVLSEGSMPLAAGFACLAGSFVMGVRGVAFMKTKALLSGLVFGFGYFLALFLLGALFFMRGMPSSPLMHMPVMGLAGGLAAGMLGALRKKPRR